MTPRAIFLTGGTGLLGAHLLAELLRRTSAPLYCLVRAPDEAAGAARLAAALADRGLPAAPPGRVVAVPGDLARPLMGLTPDAFQALAARVDTVYHSGARVNWAMPYAALKETNVGGTKEALRLACRLQPKPFHHVSSVAVFFGRGVGEHVGEDADVAAVEGLIGGYAQSKWVAERLVAEAHNRGLPTAVYRPAMIAGNGRGGFDEGDLLARTIAGCAALGAAPDVDLLLDVVPVEAAARALVHLSLGAPAAGEAYHLVSPRPLPWGELWAWLREQGRPVDLLPYDRWLALLRASATRDNPLFPLLPFLADRELLATLPAARGRVGAERALAGLAGSGIALPPVDGALLGVYVAA